MATRTAQMGKTRLPMLVSIVGHSTKEDIRPSPVLMIVAASLGTRPALLTIKPFARMAATCIPQSVTENVTVISLVGRIPTESHVPMAPRNAFFAHLNVMENQKTL